MGKTGEASRCLGGVPGASFLFAVETKIGIPTVGSPPVPSLFPCASVFPATPVMTPSYPGLNVTTRAQWGDVQLSSVWSEEESRVLQELFSFCVIDVGSVDAIVGFAEGSSKDAAERVAAAAGDSSAASVLLSEHLERNVSWLRDLHGDVAALGKRVRSSLNVPDVSASSAYLVEPETEEEYRDTLLLRKFVTSGVDLTFDPGYRPTSETGSFPPPRNLFKRVRPAVLSLLAALVQKGHAVVLPLTEARALQPVANSVPVHWVPKPSNPLGRLIADASGGPNPPNGKACREMALERFGEISLPRESEVAEFLLTAKRTYSDPVMSVDDVSGAFSRLWLSRSSAAQSTLEVTLDNGVEVGVVLSSMFFGGSSCPFAWQVMSRVLSRAFKAAGMPNLFYVDDVLRVGERENSSQEGELCKTIMCGILTPGSNAAWAADKAEWGLYALQYIGWKWDLTNLVVSITERSAVRFLLKLLRFRGSAKVSIRHLQALASLGSRFANVMPTLRPLAHIFYDAIAGVRWNSVDVVIAVSTLLRAAMDVWVSFLVRAWNDGVNWSTPLYRLVPRKASFGFQFDGSLKGVGGVHPPMVPLGCSSTEIPIFAYGVVLPYVGMKSDEQNASELIAVVFGLACAVKLGLRDVGVDFVGDSKVALSWITSCIRSDRAFRAFLLFHFIMDVAHLTVGDTFWIASEVNRIPDGLSRNILAEGFPELVSHTFNPLSTSWTNSALAFCDPTIPIPDSSSEINLLYEGARSLAISLLLP